jgi:hypothetical protein
LEWVEQALETLVRMFASQLGADIARRRIEEVNARMTGLVDLSLALGKNSASKIYCYGSWSRPVKCSAPVMRHLAFWM